VGEVSACIPAAICGPVKGTTRLGDRLVCAKLTSMDTPHDNRQHSPGSHDADDAGASRRSFVEEQAAAAPQHDAGDAHDTEEDVRQQMRDISEVAAVEVIVTSAVHLMSAAAVKCGLGHEQNAEELKDLDEARKLITALAGFVTAAAPEIGSQHAGPLRDGLRSLQLAFREASIIPDPPGKGPGEKYTGPVN
jgi:hypothetical protein